MCFFFFCELFFIYTDSAFQRQDFNTVYWWQDLIYLDDNGQFIGGCFSLTEMCADESLIVKVTQIVQ